MDPAACGGAWRDAEIAMLVDAEVAADGGGSGWVGLLAAPIGDAAKPCLSYASGGVSAGKTTSSALAAERSACEKGWRTPFRMRMRGTV